MARQLKADAYVALLRASDLSAPSPLPTLLQVPAGPKDFSSGGQRSAENGVSGDPPHQRAFDESLQQEIKINDAPSLPEQVESTAIEEPMLRIEPVVPLEQLSIDETQTEQQIDGAEAVEEGLAEPVAPAEERVSAWTLERQTTEVDELTMVEELPAIPVTSGSLGQTTVASLDVSPGNLSGSGALADLYAKLAPVERRSPVTDWQNAFLPGNLTGQTQPLERAQARTPLSGAQLTQVEGSEAPVSVTSTGASGNLIAGEPKAPVQPEPNSNSQASRQMFAEVTGWSAANSNSQTSRQTSAEVTSWSAANSDTFDGMELLNPSNQTNLTNQNDGPQLLQILQTQQPTQQGLGLSSLPGAPSTLAGNAVPMNALAVEIVRQAAQGRTQFDIRLDPPELGALTVRLQVDGAGKARAHLIVERVETLEMLTTDARGLERALQQAGLKTEPGAVSFQLAGEQSGGHEQGFNGTFDREANAQDQEGAEEATSSVLDANEEPVDSDPGEVANLHISVRGHVDVWV